MSHCSLFSEKAKEHTLPNYLPITGEKQMDLYFSEEHQREGKRTRPYPGLELRSPIISSTSMFF